MVAVVNLVLSVAVARVAGVETLGRFAVMTTTIIISLGLVRVLVCEPWLASRTAPKSAVTELRWLVLVAAAVTAAVVAGVVLVAGGGDGRWYVACPIAVLVVVQDFGRYVAFRNDRARGAFESDAAILVGGTVTFGLWALVGMVGLTAVLVSWLVGLALGTVVALRQIGGPVRPEGARAWWTKYCRPLANKLLFDGVAFLIGVNGSFYLLAFLGTQRDVGVVRIVQSVYSPVALVVAGLTMWLVPFLASHHPDQAAGVRRRVTVWLTAGSVPLVLLAILFGPWLMRIVFGLSSAPPVLALALAGLSTVAAAVAAPWVASARVSGAYSPIVVTRAAAAVVTWVGMTAIVALRGTDGYLGLVALQNVMIAVAGIAIGLRAVKTSPAASQV